VDDEQHVIPLGMEMLDVFVVGHQTAQRQYLCGEEVGSRQQLHVSPDEVRPRGCALALRGRRQTVTSQNIANRLIGNLVPKIGQRPAIRS
jgi:hypothetical protein